MLDGRLRQVNRLGAEDEPAEGLSTTSPAARSEVSTTT
jgi:hypothetical protein